MVTQSQPSAFVDDPYKIRSRTSQGDQEVTSSRGSGAYPVKACHNVNMSPDPAGKFKQTAKLHDVSLDSDDKVPNPTRVQKKRPTSRKCDSSNASFNNSYSSGTGGADLGIPGCLIPSGHRLSQQASSPSGGYHNVSFESAEGTFAESGSGPRNEAGQRKSKAAEERGKREDTGKRGVIQGASSHVRGDVGRATAYSEDPQKLRVHIKAQPGTAVHITPTATPPSTRHSHQMAGRKSLDTSGETEI